MYNHIRPPTSTAATAIPPPGDDRETSSRSVAQRESRWHRAVKRAKRAAPAEANFFGKLCLFEAAFYFAYKYGMSFSHAAASSFWFPDSILLCALLLNPTARWWIFVLAPLPMRLFVAVPPETPLWFLLATFAIDSAKGLVTAALLRHFLRNPVRFETVRDFALFCLFAVFLVPAASAFGGAAARQALGHHYWSAWEQWFLGDALAHLVITPALLYWVLGARVMVPVRFTKRWLEGILMTAGLILTAQMAFGSGTEAIGFAEPRFYAPLPFLCWAAIRFGMLGASGAIVLLAVFSVAAALGGRGPFAGHSPADTALVLQHFLLLRAAPLYLAATLIEQMKSVEQHLRESEFRLRTTTDTVPAMIWKSGLDRRLIFLNKVWMDFTGDPPEKQFRQEWTASVHPDDLQRCQEVYNGCFARRESFTLESRLRRYDGIYRWVLCTAIPCFSLDGSFLGYIGSCIDISARREAEEALQRAFDEIARLQEQLQAENIILREELKPEISFQKTMGQSAQLKYVLYKAQQVAPTDSTVLILGETGTGKELLARAIHELSGRRNRPLIKVDCATLPASLIESELFGHEKGAFTGASQKQLGRFEIADKGTIFLDEIGELPPRLQPKLLRVLQEGEFERLGSSLPTRVDVRLLAATNRNLKEEVRLGRFREDLYYRLDVYAITLPPLRERQQDIPTLVQNFVQEFSFKLGKKIDKIPQATLQALQQYPWPGNVRELKNVIERAVIVSSGDTLQVEMPMADALLAHTGRKLEEVERDHILKVLEQTNWRISGEHGAALLLGLHPNTLRSRMEKMGIKKPLQNLMRES